MSQITRRTFVKAAAAAPLILPSATLGQDKKDPPNSRLGLGFIGVGTQARGHLGYFLGQKDVQVLAVCDVDTTRRENAKKMVEQKYAEATKKGEYKGCSEYNDFRELLEQPGIDAVLIATPDHWHTIPCLEAIKAKKDIYCEKPLTLTIHEAKTLIDAVRKYDRVFQTGSQQRSSTEFRTACELVRNGRIGKLQAVYVNVGTSSKPCDLPEEKEEPGLDWDRWLGPAPKRPYNSVLSPRGVHTHFPNWRNFREYSGGMMTDWGAHHFDIAQWGLGMDESGPVEIIPPTDPKAGHGVKYVYANGIPVIHAEEYEPGKKVDGVAFIGSTGKIFVNRGKLSSDPAEVVKEPLGENDVKLYKSPGHQRDWLECVKSRKRPICDVEVGARSVTVCHLGNIAYWTRKPIKWDPKAWKFVNPDSEVAKWFDRERRDPYQLPKV
ncbi:MAG TPA: Gfo/Idh/MocA family oxidoreductase [Gemmataceae bacterium]|nr:Gfo/Idh/MocA family oxidoreductase [Gemmataceae bacterium]